MRHLALLLLVSVPLAATGGTIVRTFDDDPASAPPRGFLFSGLRDAAPGRWTVQREGIDGILAHGGDPNASRGLSLALMDAPPVGEVEISVRLRLLSGERAGGLVWRYRDEGNFYLARLRLSDQSVTVYRVINGNRIRVEAEDDLELDPAAWHALKVVQRRESARIYIGGVKVFELRDRTFRAPGRVGVCADAGSTVWFNDLTVRPGEE